MKKYFYFFGKGKTEGKAGMKDILGGKGANLAEMSRLGVPVPPGFIVSTEVCQLFNENKMRFPKSLDKEFLKYLKRLEDVSGRKFGDARNPLFVSVRSGAKFSMPGMMDTILNLGLNDQTIQALINQTKNPGFAYDCYHRLIQMFGNVVAGIDKNIFPSDTESSGRTCNNRIKRDLTENQSRRFGRDPVVKTERFKQLFQEHSGAPFPQNPLTQLRMARDAVFKSWNNPRAQTYRKLYHIPHTLGTAVNIQMMVFGNMDESSATGVGFTRNPATGEKTFYGEYLIKAQGEDVVAGVRTPKPIKDLVQDMPKLARQLQQITSRLERHYKDVQDFEFTIERNKLYILQTRTGKRTGLAAVKIAVDLAEEGLISTREAVRRVEPLQLNQLLHPMFDPEARKGFQVIAKGLAASPGAASGQVFFHPDRIVQETERGKRTILVRRETSPDDIHGMHRARGVLTATGGMTSHAAVVGRQMGKPSVVGCEAIKVDEANKRFRVPVRTDVHLGGGELTVKEGDHISIDGSTGEVMLGDVPTKESEIMQVIKGKLAPKEAPSYYYFARILSWADKIRRLKVRANADIPRDANYAIKLGAEGIGLCRTEHMFFAEDRLPIMQEMILATSSSERQRALDKLLPLQRKDFVGLFEAMRGYPVTIRTLDPPLHEFLPRREDLMVEIAVMKASPQNVGTEEISKKEKLLARVNELHEFNPMMGHRGCRLGITYPEITEMQVRAIFEAAVEVAQKGKPVVPEVMIPLVGDIGEFQHQAKIVHQVAEAVMKASGIKIKYSVGTMIEVPRAAITADEIARAAEFFSYGTNDLTQMTYGFSRDDAGRVINQYLTRDILKADPFVTIDQIGVGQLMEIGVKKGRGARANLKIGICGEHGGEPASVMFCHRIGLDYVSASPFRVPIARLAAAHAVLASSASHR